MAKSQVKGTKRVAIKPADAFAKVDMTTRQASDMIIARWHEATLEQVTAGRMWYGYAFELATEMSKVANISIERAAIIIAHLSPRVQWVTNKRYALELATTGERPAGSMRQMADKALAALTADDPWSTFGPTSPKTRAFAENILGLPTAAVTVDVHTVEAIGLDTSVLGLTGVYEAVAHAYRLAAARLGEEVSTLQAVVWVVQRGRAE